jgi:integrase/recombinase XerD
MLCKMIDEYLEYADRELGCTEKTIYGYRYQFTLLVRFFSDIQVETITIDMLNQYFRSEEDRGLAPSSVNSARAAIRCFFYYCQYYRHTDLAFDSRMIRKKKCDPSEVKVASEEDVRRVLAALDSPQDKLMVLVMYQTCMRISELVKLKVEDIYGKEVKTFGKGRKHRLVCITDEMAEALQKHMADNKIYTGPIFRSKSGGGYSISGLRNRFVRKLQPHGIYAGFHWFRHGGATDMMRNGADLYFLKEYLGHSDIRTTQIYLHITDREKVLKFEKFYLSPIKLSEVLT